MHSHIWVKHDVENMVSKVFRPNVQQISEGSEDVSSDDHFRVVKFDDTEKERTCERNEGFVKVTMERLTRGNMIEVNGNSLRLKVQGNKNHNKIKSTSKINMFVPANMIDSSSKRNPTNVGTKYVDHESE